MKMGESACLLRSFSHPSDAARELREGDRIRALTESVTFGRFMTESLAWERWSAFSHNRYLEEVEKLARPGSVAEKKAYFEAHYRRRAAVREESLVTEPTSAGEIETPSTEVEQKSVGGVEDLTTKLGQTESDHHMECYEREEEGSSGSCGAGSVCSPDVSLDESKSENIEMASPESLEQGTAIENMAKEEKLAKPESFDQKKAYFEAHYQRIAAIREESPVTEPTSAGEIESPFTQVEQKSVGGVEDLTAKLEQTESDHHMECYEREEEGSPDSHGAGSVCSPDVSLDESKPENIEMVSPESLQQGSAIENIANEENLLQRCDLDACVEIGSSESQTKEATNGKKPTMPFSKSVVDRSKASKLLSPRAKVSTTNEEKLRKDTAPCREKLLFEKKKLVSKSHHTDEEKLRKDTSLSREKLLVEKKKPVSNSHHINEEKLRKGTAPCREKLPVEKKKPVSNSDHTNEEKLNKDTALSREKLFVEKKKKPFFKSLHTNEEKLRKDTARSREKLLVEKKKPFPKSLHMSISFAPSNVSTSKTISPVLQQIIKLKDITASTKLQQEIPVAQKLPDGASVHAKNTVTPVILKSEDRRMKGLLNKSDAGRPMMSKSSSLLHKENSKYSFANGVKSQPPVVCTPFRFRSEERAAKRKEKQEEKLKALEAEKMKASEGNQLLTMPSRSPELAKKASQGIGSQTKPKPLQQTSYRVDNANQRIGKSNNPNAKAPILSLLSSRSHAHENSSPNIPQ